MNCGSGTDWRSIGTDRAPFYSQIVRVEWHGSCISICTMNAIVRSFPSRAFAIVAIVLAACGTSTDNKPGASKAQSGPDADGGTSADAASLPFLPCDAAGGRCLAGPAVSTCG